MLEKTIKSVIVRKLAAWFVSIEDKDLQEEVRKGVIVTGGSIVSLMQNEKPNDYDIYFRTKELTEKVAQYYIDEFKETHPSKEIFLKPEEDRIRIYIRSAGIEGENPDEDREEKELIEKCSDPIENKEEKEKKPYEAVFLTSNAITLRNGIQLVVRFYGEPSDIHDTYDFVHTKAYYTSWNKFLEIPKEVYESVFNKRLVYTGSKYPLCSLFRMRKFIERGWSINAGQILKAAFQVSELDLTDLDILEDQLVGVDYAFFQSLIAQLKAQKEKDPDFRVDTNYLTNVINKVFG